MARPIILAMEEYEGTDPNDLDFSDFEPVMDPVQTDSVISDLGDTVDSLGDLETHTEIVDIIATEGVGNRPQIAAIALSALEQRLFGQPVVGTRVGTESRTRIATEGKNIFVRVWKAIVKFFNKIWSRLKSLFSSSKKSREKKVKDIKEAKVNGVIEQVKNLDKPKAKEIVESGKKPTKEEVKDIIDTNNDKTADAFTKALHMISLMRKDINLFSKYGVGPKELLGDKSPFHELDSITDNHSTDVIEETVDEWVELLSDYNDEKTRDRAAWKVENYPDEIFKKSIDNVLEKYEEMYVPSYKEFKLFNWQQVRKSHQVKLTESDIQNPNIPFIEHAKFILEKKDKIVSALTELVNFEKEFDKYMDERLNDLKEINKVIDSITFSQDKIEKKISDNLTLGVSALLIVDHTNLAVISSCIKFLDSLHRLIMICDEGKTE